MIYQPDKDSYLLSKVLQRKLPKLLKKNPNLKLLEIGAGSGIQLQTALDKGIKLKNIFATDINQKAVKVCKDQGFNCINSDLFDKVKGKFDIILFNPPYLPRDEREPLDSQLATTGGEKGSEIINIFLEQVKKYLKKDGKVWLLVSSLTKDINFKGMKRKIIARDKIFFEELKILEIR